MAESRPLVKDAFPPVTAKDLTLRWLEKDPKAFMEPILIPNPDGLGMKVLPKDIKISEIAKKVGSNKPIDVIGKNGRHVALLCMDSLNPVS